MSDWQNEYKTRLRTEGLMSIKKETNKLRLENWTCDKRKRNDRMTIIFNNAKLFCCQELLAEFGLKEVFSSSRKHLSVEFVPFGEFGLLNSAR